MNTITQGTLYRFRSGGFPEVAHESLNASEQAQELHALEDLFAETRALDQSAQDEDHNPGAVRTCQREGDPATQETRTYKGDTRNGQLAVGDEQWSVLDCDEDQSRWREARFSPVAVDAIDVHDNGDGVVVHLWHMDRLDPSRSFQQSF